MVAVQIKKQLGAYMIVTVDDAVIGQGAMVIRVVMGKKYAEGLEIT
jgi:hypothetical protein